MAPKAIASKFPQPKNAIEATISGATSKEKNGKTILSFQVEAGTTWDNYEPISKVELPKGHTFEPGQWVQINTKGRVDHAYGYVFEIRQDTKAVTADETDDKLQHLYLCVAWAITVKAAERRLKGKIEVSPEISKAIKEAHMRKGDLILDDWFDIVTAETLLAILAHDVGQVFVVIPKTGKSKEICLSNQFWAPRGQDLEKVTTEHHQGTSKLSKKDQKSKRASEPRNSGSDSSSSSEDSTSDESEQPAPKLWSGRITSKPNTRVPRLRTPALRAMADMERWKKEQEEQISNAAEEETDDEDNGQRLEDYDSDDESDEADDEQDADLPGDEDEDTAKDKPQTKTTGKNKMTVKFELSSQEKGKTKRKGKEKEVASLSSDTDESDSDILEPVAMKTTKTRAAIKK